MTTPSSSNDQRKFDLDAEEQFDNRRARIRYGLGIYRAAIGWQFFVGGIVVLEALTPPAQRLSDPVMVALLGSSPVSIVGALIVLAKYYFPSRAD